MADTFYCSMCGAPLEYPGSGKTMRCPYCNNSVIVPAQIRSQKAATSLANADLTPQQIPDEMKQIALLANSGRKIDAIKLYRQITSVGLAEAKNAVEAMQTSPQGSTFERQDPLGINEHPVPDNLRQRGYLVFVVIFVVVALIIVSTSMGSKTSPFANFFSAESVTSTAAIPVAPVATMVPPLAPPTAAPRPDYFVLNPVILAPLQDVPSSQLPDILVPARDMRGEQINQMLLLDGKKHTITWQTADFGHEYWSAVKTLPTEKQVYFLNQTSLTALDRQTGKLNWEVTLEYGPGNYCTICLGQYQNTLVVFLKDGSLQAVDVSTGQLTWRQILNDTDADLLTVGGKPAVQDSGPGDKTVFKIFDPASGEITTSFELACMVQDTQDYLNHSFVSADGKSLLLFYDYCLQRVSLADGKVLSQASTNAPQVTLPATWSDLSYFLTPEKIYYSAENAAQAAVYQVDLTSGDGRMIISENKYSLFPALVSGNVLVLAARAEFDGNLLEYWGVDIQSGQRLWRYTLKAEGQLMDFGIRLTSDGVFVVQCRWDPDGCAWANLDPQTGAPRNSGLSPLGGTSVDFTWDDDRLYLVGNFALAGINTLDSQVLFQWP